VLVSSGYPFCSEELCIRFLCQELSAPKILLSECPLQGISVSEGSTVSMSARSAVDQRFAWMTEDSLKHILEGLVIF